VRLAGHGVRELVLVSQDSVRYGVDLYGQPRLAELLRLLDQVEGLSWIRLMYTYPAFWSDELLEVFAHGTRICAYVDLPLQHIADPVLRRMRRAATRRQTEELLARLRQRLPGAGFRSTFIVGFPGETEAQYEELLDFVTTARFDHATGFAYSPEEGTAAHDLEGAVPEEVAQERLGRLLEAQEQVSTANNHALLGTRQTVLVDGPDELGRTCGRTERDAPEIDGQVVIEAGAVEPGRFVEVEVTGAAAHELTGRVVGRPY
jgi:ribosomal protein S12 methylthiotransferase